METVLIVEDHEVSLHAMTQILGLHGYAVLPADNTEIAVEVCKEYPGPVDLVIADATVRHDGGKQLARQIAELKPKAKFLYVSGYSSAELIHNGELDSDAPFLQKPLTAELLTTTVQRVLHTPRAAS